MFPSQAFKTMPGYLQPQRGAISRAPRGRGTGEACGLSREVRGRKPGHTCCSRWMTGTKLAIRPAFPLPPRAAAVWRCAPPRRTSASRLPRSARGTCRGGCGRAQSQSQSGGAGSVSVSGRAQSQSQSGGAGSVGVPGITFTVVSAERRQARPRLWDGVDGERHPVGPEVGPTSAFARCIPTGCTGQLASFGPT